MNPAKRRAIYETLRQLNPHPTTELEFATPFELLVAVVLSAQATDKSVNAATRVLYKVANTPAAIVAARRGKPHRVHQDDRAVPHQGAQRHRGCPGSCSSATAAKCRASAKPSRRCPASAARRRTSS